MTQTMVERVAAAIAEQYAPMHDARAPYAKFAAKAAAEAAIKAMREPTTRMIGWTDVSDELSVSVWQDMIDGALQL